MCKIKSVKYPKLDITFMTAHSSKGLGYDDVIIVNGKNETYGFPSKIEDDPVLAFAIAVAVILWAIVIVTWPGLKK